MSIIIGSARVDERGKYSGGSAGDQKQTSSNNDQKGEVSMQPFYVHSKGWIVMRLKSALYAKKTAKNMKTACNNKNLGYDQWNRTGVNEHGVDSKVKTECDCSSLVRECIKEATGKDPGNFNTENEVSVLKKTGLFKDPITYSPNTKLYNGDVLVTKTKGHTVIVVSGREREDDSEKAKTTKTASKKTSSSSNSDFVKEVQKAIGAKVDGVAGPETISKTITVSRTNNRSHAVVKIIQKQLNKLGYSCGTVDGIAGIKFDRAVKRYQKDKGCVVDGILTAGGKTWKKLLGM